VLSFNPPKGIFLEVFMKKFAAGLWTTLCATAISFAQPTSQPLDQATAPAINPGIQASVQDSAQSNLMTAEQAFADAQQSNTMTAEQAFADAQAKGNKAASATAEKAAAASPEQADQAPIDAQAFGVTQPLVPKKKSAVGFGAKASFIYGKFWGFKDLLSDGMENPTGPGGEFGLAARFGKIEGLQFVPEIAFRFLNLSHEDDDVKREYNQKFFDLAFYMRGIVSNKFFMEIGPQLSIKISAEYTFDGSSEFENIEQAPIEFGLNIGAGYFVMDKLSIGFRWYMGFNEVFPDVKYRGDFTMDDYDKNGKPKGHWSTINLSGAQSMMFKFNATYWFI